MHRTMFHFLILVLLQLGISTQVSADNGFRNQYAVGLSAGSKEYEEYRIDYAYYFEDVDLGGGPFDVSAFMSKASNLQVSVVGLEDLGGSRDGYELGYRGVLKESGFLFNLFYSGELNDNHDQVLSLDVGAYINDNGTITIGYERIDSAFDSENQKVTWRVKTDYVGNDNINYRFGFELGFVTFEQEGLDQELLLGFSTSIYPIKKLSIDFGASVETRTLRTVLTESTADPEPTVEENQLELFLGFGWFFNPAIELSFEYKKVQNVSEFSKLENAFTFVDREQYNLMLLWRM